MSDQPFAQLGALDQQLYQLPPPPAVVAVTTTAAAAVPVTDQVWPRPTPAPAAVADAPPPSARPTRSAPPVPAAAGGRGLVDPSPGRSPRQSTDQSTHHTTRPSTDSVTDRSTGPLSDRSITPSTGRPPPRSTSRPVDPSPILGKPLAFYLTEQQNRALDQMVGALEQRLHGKLTKRLDRSTLVRLLLDEANLSAPETIDRLAQQFISRLIRQLTALSTD